MNMSIMDLLRRHGTLLEIVLPVRVIHYITRGELEMNKSKAITYLRMSYWVGAIFNALVILPMLSPKVAGVVFGISPFTPGNDYGYAMSIAATLMGGWVFLLIWADRKPIERRGVLLLTVIPVLPGLIFSGVYAVVSGFIRADEMLETWIMQGLLALLFGFSYLKANKLDS
jgi:hypothetical protein